MKIEVKYIKTPVETIKVRKISGAKGGKIGGKAKVPKGFATMDEKTGEYLLAKRAGAIGGKISKRGRAKK